MNNDLAAATVKEASTVAIPQGRNRLAWLRRASVMIGFALLSLVFSLLTESFYQWGNIREIMLQSSINAIIALGMTLVVMTSGIDLSVGSIVGLTCMVTASLLTRNLWLAISIGLALGLACGAFNGLLVAKVKLPAFIVTLGTLSIYRGIALIYTNGQPIYGIDPRFRTIFAGQVLGIPTPVLIAITVAILVALMLRYTPFGEHIVAVGGNEEAARLSGINTDRVKIIIYGLSGLLAAVAGFVLIGRIGAAEPIGGQGYELDAIGAAVIGGASLFGGEGSAVGTLIGALLLGALRNGLTLLNVQSFWQYVATGAVVILAVVADQLTRGHRK